MERKLSFPNGQITLNIAKIYPEVYLEQHPDATVRATTTIYNTNVPVTIADLPVATVQVSGAGNLSNASEDHVTVGSGDDGVQGTSIALSMWRLCFPTSRPR